MKKLVKRISAKTQVPPEVVAKILRGDGHLSDQCWLWLGAVTNNDTPVMSYEGRTWTVRRALHTAMHGPLQAYESVVGICWNHICVNPAHSTVRQVQNAAYFKALLAGEVSLPGVAPIDPNDLSDDPEYLRLSSHTQEESLEDIAWYVYRSPEPWDADKIAESCDLCPIRVKQAIEEILAGKL